MYLCLFYLSKKMYFCEDLTINGVLNNYSKIYIFMLFRNIHNSRIESSEYDDYGYISKLISEGEHQHLDFKFGINDSKKIAISIVAFANSEGGRLLVGVKDNGNIAGVRSEEEYYMIQAASEMYTTPEVAYTAKEWLLQKKKVLEIIIPKSPDKLHFVKDVNRKTCYVRVEDSNFPVNAVWIKAFHKRNTQVTIGETEIDLLKLLENHDSLSINRISFLSKIPYRKLTEILSNLVAMGFVNINFGINGAKYSLKQKVQ